MQNWFHEGLFRLLIWGAMILSVLVPLGPPLVLSWFRRRLSPAWPETLGTVEQHKSFTWSNQTDVQGFGFTYSYSVGRDYFAGEMLASRPFRFPESEEDVQRVYPIGSKVRVRYRPDHPDISVVIPHDLPRLSVNLPARDDPAD